MKKMITKPLIFSSCLCLLPIAVSFIIYSRMPETVATHWNINWQPNGFVSKNFFLFGMPLLMLGLNIFLNVVASHDKNKLGSNKLYFVLAGCTVPITFIVAYVITVINALYGSFDGSRILIAVVCLFLIFMGNYMPKTKQNKHFGVRTKWTFKNPDNWSKVNRISGYLFVGAGVLGLIALFIPINAAPFIPVGLVVMAVLGTAVVNSVCIKNEKNKTEGKENDHE